MGYGWLMVLTFCIVSSFLIYIMISGLYAKLHNQRKSMDAILSNMEDGLIITDAAGKITYANQMVQRVVENEGNRLNFLKIKNAILRKDICSASPWRQMNSLNLVSKMTA